ncbi:hypothetical protein Q1695_010354 [Nippostrongylus brasiliensis]|nr:hypothetical protein Q1695_010354 [Nippostrongylus brasiliensis]
MSLANGALIEAGDSDIPVEVPTCGRVLAIAGCTNSGKTTVAKILSKMFVDEGATVHIIHQDDFYLAKEKACLFVEKVHRKSEGTPNFFYNYDSKFAVDHWKLINAIKATSLSYDYIIVEGNMLTEWTDLVELCDRVIFLTLDQDTCRRRRTKRSYDPPDMPGYFDEVVWPSYQGHLQAALALAREDRRISFLDVSSDSDHPQHEFIMSRLFGILHPSPTREVALCESYSYIALARNGYQNESIFVYLTYFIHYKKLEDNFDCFQLIHAFSDDVVRICYEPLDVGEAVELINSPSCGGTSVFVGTTRDTFNGRKVARLDYESYDEMAYKEMRKLCAHIREKFPSVERVVMFHRIGEVGVGETSVIIATASPHRKDALHATEMAIDELKRVVPIWKKEVYEDGGCSWKENGEWCGGAEHRDENGTCTEEKSFAEASRTRDANRKVFWLRQMVKQMNIKPS